MTIFSRALTLSVMICGTLVCLYGLLPGRAAGRAEQQPATAQAERLFVEKIEPALAAKCQTCHGVDAFVLQKLNEKAIKPAPTAKAFEKVVERLLGSPRYGERWGRHWLDVVRYADTAGGSNDYERPNAWRYRDYVISSFNEDKPYDRFILEQIAGDELDSNNAENLIATGFLRMGPWEHTSMSVEAVTRQEWLDDVTQSTVTAFLGLTMGCAKCHDHKFDPIPAKDYYGVQAVFATTYFEERPAPFLPYENISRAEASRAQLQLKLECAERKYDETASALGKKPRRKAIFT